MIIDPLDDAHEAIRVPLAVGEQPELAERIVLEGIRHAQAVDEAFEFGAVGVHAHDCAGAAAAGDFAAVGAGDFDIVVADAHVEFAVGSPFENEHAKGVPGFGFVLQEEFFVGGEGLLFLPPLTGEARFFIDVVGIQELARAEPQLVALDGDAHDRIGETIGDQRAMPFAVGILFEPHDGVGVRLDRRARRTVAIRVALADDDASLVVHHHRDRVDDERIGDHQLDLEILRHDEVLELLLGGQAFRDRLIDGIGAVIGGSAFFALGDGAAGQVPGADRWIAEDDGGKPTRIVEIGFEPGVVVARPFFGLGAPDFRFLIGDDEDILLVGGLDAQPGDGPGDAALIGRLDRQDVLADHEVLGNVVRFDGAPFAVAADLLAIDVGGVDVIDGDPQFRGARLGGEIEREAQIARVIGLCGLVTVGFVPDPHGAAPAIG